MLWNLEVRDRNMRRCVEDGLKPVLFPNCNTMEHSVTVIQSRYDKRVNEYVGRFIAQQSTYLAQLPELPEA